MGHFLEVQWDSKKTGQYIVDILTLNLCKLFFPATFVCSDNVINVTYDVEKFRRLSSIPTIGTEDCLTVVIELLNEMYNGEKHYIFSDEYEINTDTVYVDRSFSKVKMTFIPCEETVPGPEKVIDLLLELRKNCLQEGVSYIDKVIEYISNVNFSYRNIINYIEKLRKEVYLCAVE